MVRGADPWGGGGGGGGGGIFGTGEILDYNIGLAARWQERWSMVVCKYICSQRASPALRIHTQIQTRVRDNE